MYPKVYQRWHVVGKEEKRSKANSLRSKRPVLPDGNGRDFHRLRPYVELQDSCEVAERCWNSRSVLPWLEESSTHSETKLDTSDCMKT